MRKKRKQRKQSNSARSLPRHPFLPSLHLTVWMRLTCVAIALCLVFVPAVSSGASAEGNSGPAKDQKEKRSHQNDFLIFGTVFTDQGFSLPGAIIRVRRSGEKKVAGEATADRRGEFAVRVPQGAEYEITVAAKGFQDETRKIDAQSGNREDLVFRLRPVSGGKPK